MQNAAEDIRVDNLVTPQNAAGGAVNTNAGMYRSMKYYRKGVVVVTATLTDTKTCIAQLTQSSAAAAADKANVSGKTITLTGAAATSLNQVGMITFDVDDLAFGSGGTYNATQKLFVGCDLTTNQAGDCVSAVLIRRAPRYVKGGPAATTGANAQDA